MNAKLENGIQAVKMIVLKTVLGPVRKPMDIVIRVYLGGGELLATSLAMVQTAYHAKSKLAYVRNVKMDTGVHVVIKLVIQHTV